MREHWTRDERVTAGTRSFPSPVQMISSGVAAGTWLLDPGSSGVRVSLKRHGYAIAGLDSPGH
jgi:hypothetical protein